jgi:hypothetical protein
MSHPKAEVVHHGEHDKDTNEGLDTRLGPGLNVVPGGVDLAAQARDNVENKATDRTNQSVEENDRQIDTLLKSVGYEHDQENDNAQANMLKCMQFFSDRAK